MKEGWKIVKLGEVCEVINGYAFDSKLFSTEQGKPLIRIRDIKRGYTETFYVGDYSLEYIVKKGDFLIGMDGEFNIGEWKSEDALLNQRVCKLVGSKEINIKYVYYYIPESLKIIENKTSFATVKHLSSKQIKAIELPLPPLEEQHRIVGILDAAFAKIDALKKNAEANLANAKALFQQVLAQELQPKEGWVEKKLGEIGVGKLTYGSATPAQDYDGAVRYVRITDIDDNGNLSNERKSPSTIDAKYFLNEGDLLFARTGATVGKTYLYKKSDGRCLYAGYLIRLKVNKDVVNPLFVFHCTKTSTYWDFIKKSQRTAAQPNINAEQYSNYTISFPPSIEEQHRIVRTLDTLSDKCRRLEQVAQQTIRECDALKQSILRRAFSGEL